MPAHFLWPRWRNRHQTEWAFIHPATARPIAGPESSWTKCTPGTVTSLWFFHARQNSHTGPIRIAPGSALTNSFGISFCTIHSNSRRRSARRRQDRRRRLAPFLSAGERARKPLHIGNAAYPIAPHRRATPLPCSADDSPIPCYCRTTMAKSIAIFGITKQLQK
jgi:hypothetical protein